jgi:hypothetical protein
MSEHDDFDEEDQAKPSEGAPPQGFAGFAQLAQLAQLASQLDPQGIVAGVGQAMSWAREAVVAPHALHQDPAEHPECVICKGMSVVQGASAREPEPTPEVPAIHWIPVTRMDGETSPRLQP